MDEQVAQPMVRLVQPDAIAFLDMIQPLVSDEARNNLILGLAGMLVTSPDVYPDHDLFVLERSDRVVAAGLITRPMNLILADADANDSEGLAMILVQQDIEIPGVIGNRPTIDGFVHRWTVEAGEAAKLEMRQGVFALDTVLDVPRPDGVSRLARLQDRACVLEWLLAFSAEALPRDPVDHDRMKNLVDRRLQGETSAAFWVWEQEGEPVAMSGHSGPAGSGIRISAVYTPPESRGRGFATALVADQSRWLLTNGFNRCFLLTDLANFASNRIYERIGYRQVAESAIYTLGDRSRIVG